MGDVSDNMINGRLCHACGVFLEPKEVVCLVSNGNKVKMPDTGGEFGVPVYCKDCNEEHEQVVNDKLRVLVSKHNIIQGCPHCGDVKCLCNTSPKP